MNAHQFLLNLFTGASLALGLTSTTALAAPTSDVGASPRERISLDDGWRFTKGDSPDAGTNLTYAALRDWILPTGNPFTTNPPVAPPTGPPPSGFAYAQPDFNDSAWRLLNLPHDWGIEGPFKQDYPGNTGKLPWWGRAWYRKHLDLPASDAGRKIYLDVDGAMAYATVWVNGQFAGGWPYGYASWRVELTPFLKFGSDNVIAIRLDNPPDSSRWYPGGGIYRNVWLVKTTPVHVGHWGIYVTTPQITRTQATVHAQVTVNNDDPIYPQDVFVRISVLDPKGKTVGTAQAPYQKIPSGGSARFDQDVVVKNPKLWDLDHPELYRARVEVRPEIFEPIASGSSAAMSDAKWPAPGSTFDEDVVSFGIRTIQFTPDNGFLLNGKRVPIQGVCDHHDLGALGAAINTRALERQIEILKAMGCNAIRTSHNPPAPELLDLCDRMGMLVMDESFDCWERGKTKNDYHLLFDDWHERDWRAELRRDRNHPCIVLWSIGNEVGEQKHPDKFWIAAELTAIAHQEDPTRPTTSANSDTEAGYNGFATNEDVFGYNYKPWEYGKFRAANPAQPLFGSETASCISSRGEYFYPLSTNPADGMADFQMSSYDLYAPHWATPPEVEFRGQDENPFVAGEFVWTGFDYLGEPTPYGNDSKTMLEFTDPALKALARQELEGLGRIIVPSRSSYFGIVDLAGFPKDRYYLYQSRWRPDLPMAHIVPQCWNWPERVGQVTPVHVYTSGDSAELFLNGQSLGRKTKGPLEYRLEWNDVVYQPGTLKVVAYKNGQPWATNEVKTTGAPAKLTLQADRDRICDDGKDLSYITVTVADKRGLRVPKADNHIRFKIEGPGEIVATDNGDATSFESFQAPEHNAFNGLALVIVRAKAGEPGTIKLIAKSDGLKPAAIKIKSR